MAKNIRELETALQEEWSQTTDDVLMNLIKSMPRRVVKHALRVRVGQQSISLIHRFIRS